MNIVFFGCTSFSEKILKELIKIKYINIEAIFSIPSDFSISYNKEKVKNTNFKDLSIYADQLEIPGQQVRLRYVNCPQVPFIDSAETEVCNGL